MMTERSRTAGEELLSTLEAATATAGVLSGLNRINTRRRLSSTNKLSSKPDELAESTSYGAAAASSAKPPVVESKQKNQTAEGGRRRTTPASKEELRGGKKMVQWLSSYFSQDSNHASFEICSSFEEGTLEAEALDRNYNAGTKSSRTADRLNGKVSSSANPSRKKVPIGLKSYSHELGPKGGIQVQPPPHRAHSYSNLEELLGSLHSRFDATKELVDTELNKFLVDAMDALEKIELSLEEQKMAMDLLLLAQFCIDMACSKFRTKCEMIVQDLTEKRQQCQTGFLKWLFTRMLFILTRCTRLLQFQKDREPLDENSLRDFKKCIESIPSVETSWITNHGIADSGSGYSLYQKGDGKRKFEDQTNTSSLPQEVCGGSIESANQSQEASRKDSVDLEETLPSWKSKKDAEQIQPSRLTNNNFIENSVTNLSCVSNYEQGQSLLDPVHEEERVLDGSDSVICRICEEIVPISHLESHSYICAYADKCDLNCLDIDERLSNLEEILEQIIESRNTDFHPSIESPENSRIQATSSVIADGCSPKISEWRSKGVEGMFEDIHEMDTAYIDDLHMSPVNLKPPLGIKLCNYGGSFSTASVTSASSTNTPRAGQFDSFWLEHNNPSELEDIKQMIDLADIARCVAGTDISKEGSSEFLLACMQDLQDILHHTKLRALVIDTFGGRIEKLLREKYILACDLIDSKSPRGENKQKELPRLLLDNASQSSAGSTPVHSSHKDRTSIDDFEIIKPISRGAFGRVFLARKRTTGDLFAIKVVKGLDMLRKNDVQRILAERNILITVRNPFVVRFFYSFTCRDNLYLVMEYLNGGDLYSLLRNVGYLEEDIARIYMAELVLALEYLHSLGIVHRDLKPDNILIAHDGHIKLTDFGLSKIGLINSTIDLSGPEINGNTSLDAFNPHAQQRENSSHHSAVGTPDYLAPEILLGTEHGYASDWWSVGIILFELITGIPPFTADSPEKIFDNILNKKIPWPNVPENMSYEAQDLINRLITHDPQERLGANGSAEVKAHPFFGGVDWDNLALQKAAFVPNPDSADDTSYFLSRFSQMSLGMLNDQKSDDSDSDSSDSSRNSGAEMDEFGELADFGSASFDLSLMNFSFKNLSQLASINHDVLLQSGKQSPSRAPDKSGSSPI